MEPFIIPLNILIPISIVVIILIAVIWILFFKTKKITKKIVTEKIKYINYKKQIDSLKNSRESPKKDFENLSNITRNFFNEYYNLNHSLTYLELAKRFAKKNKKEYAKFCKQMSDLKYSGKQINANQIKQLINEFDIALKTKKI